MNRQMMNKGVLIYKPVLLSLVILFATETTFSCMSTPVEETPQGKKVLMVWGGWDGHEPKQCVDIFQPWLEEMGAEVTVSNTLDAYLDKELMDGVDLIIQVYTMGTITGEHGVGIEKLDQMCTQFSAAELAQLHAVKQAFDPDALLNPGKAVPTLHRCAEFGAMHVHDDKLAFPELERF